MPAPRCVFEDSLPCTNCELCDTSILIDDDALAPLKALYEKLEKWLARKGLNAGDTILWPDDEEGVANAIRTVREGLFKGANTGASRFDALIEAAAERVESELAHDGGDL